MTPHKKIKKQLIATRGPRIGICNICGEEGKLTEDHTPPKGSIKIGQVELKSIINHLNIDIASEKGRVLQNGVKYRTLCHSCNNNFLGTKYDPAFNEFVNTIGNYLKTEIELPPIISIHAKPQKIMRALIGHLAAQGVGRYKKGAETETIRDYFLDTTLPLPPNLRIYYWLFPYKNHVMARDCVYMDLNVGEPCIIWFIKFFPIGFMVTFDQPEELTFNLNELSIWRAKDINYQSTERIRLSDIQHQFWPEAPSEHAFLAYGQEAIVSYKYIPKSKKK